VIGDEELLARVEQVATHPDHLDGRPAPVLPLPTTRNGTDAAAELPTPPVAPVDTLVAGEACTASASLAGQPTRMPARTADPVATALAEALAAVESMVSLPVEDAPAPPRDTALAPPLDAVASPPIAGNGTTAPAIPTPPPIHADIAAPAPAASTAPPAALAPDVAAAPTSPPIGRASAGAAAPAASPLPVRASRTGAAVVLDGPGHPVHSARRRRRSASLLPPLPAPADIPEDAAGRVAIIAISAPPDVESSFAPAPRSLAAPVAASEPDGNAAAVATAEPTSAAERSVITAITGGGPVDGWIPVIALGIALLVIFVVGVLVTR
jgi:hypothetical protein